MGHPYRIQFGPFLIDISERVLRHDGQPVPLTPKAFDLLAALLERPGQLISKEELLQKVWPDTFVEESNLAYNVFALRKALGDTAENSSYIETVPKKGYRFTAVARPVVTAVRASALPDAENTVLLFHKGPVRSQAAVELKPELGELPAEISPAPSEFPPARRFSLPRWMWIGAVPVLVVALFLRPGRGGSQRPSPSVLFL